MANSDDPPFLTVGTEVSAKYRGAFCEATIKVAKKVVKCKVAYSKGQTAMVNDDVIKGPLKVSAQVEVRQQDGQTQTATITKLTDQSTYTVVFDDGDERTLKRSSLCLKGGRHFDMSESLDNLPLTDPENFGTPVVIPNKSGRRRGRLSNPISNGEEAESGKKGYSYPPEYPVGKTVFLENDRRRAWLPAVIVPAHYVLPESDMKPDTICLRSFKDGRFFAATKDELHEFAPDKEPLSSMLEGEIQSMYMNRPAIERAMAFLDTGELPWGMDLFNERKERQGDSGGKREKNEEISEQQLAERDSFMERLKKFHESKGTPLTRTPILAQKDLDLFRLYQLVQENGGMERVTQEMKWRSLYLQLGMPLSTNASHAIKQAYKRYLYGFEVFEKGKSKAGRAKESPGRGRKRAAALESEEEAESKPEKLPKRDVSEKQGKAEVVERTEPRTTRLSRQASKEARDSLREAKESKPTREQREPPSSRNGVRDGGREGREGREVKSSSKTSKDVKMEVAEERKVNEKAESPLAVSVDSKSDLSDHESSQGETTSTTTGEETEEMERRGDDWAKREGKEGETKYAENDRILVWYGKGKNLRTYEAKIIGMEESESRRDYLVHYSGWNNRYNEWIEESRICKKITNPTKHVRPQYSKKKGKQTPKAEDGPKAKKKTAREKEREKEQEKEKGNEKEKETESGGKSKPKEGEKETRIPTSLPPSLPTKTHSAPPTPEVGGGGGGVSSGRLPSRGPGRPPKKRRLSGSGDPVSERDSSPSPPSAPQPPASEAHHNDKTSVKSPLLATITESCADTPSQVPPLENGTENYTCDEAMEMSCAIEVKKEENSSWALPPDSLLCAEKFSGSAGDLRVKPAKNTKLGDVQSTSTSESAGSGMEEEPPPPTPLPSPPPQSVPLVKSPEKVWPSGSPQQKVEPPSTAGEEEEEEEEKMEVEKLGDDKSSVASSEKESSPVYLLNSQPQLRRNELPVIGGKRKWRGKETEEEYELRRIARRESLNFHIDFSNRPEMTCGERVQMIENHIRLIQQKWTDLKSEVAYLDRRRRRARRKEREAARILAQAHQHHHPSSSTQTTVECH